MAAMEQPQQAAQGQREFPAAGREDVFQRALVGFAPGAQLGVGLMQLGEILLQGLDGLLLVSRSLFQLVEVLLLADAGLLEILYALENGGLPAPPAGNSRSSHPASSRRGNGSDLPA